MLFKDRTYLEDLCKMNDTQTLLNKAIENIKIADYAKSNSSMNVSISRYYYSAFQTILYMIEKDSESSKKQNDDNKNINGKDDHIMLFQEDDSHVKTFNKFFEIAMKLGITNDEKLNLIKFQILKRRRREADYTTIDFNELDFDKCFLNDYKKFRDTVNLIKNKIQKQ
jgi:hypothetical protein